MESLRPRVGQIVVHLLDELAGQPQPADFHDAVSFPLPVLVICELLGVPFSDRDLFRGWPEDVGRMDDEQRSQDGFRRLWGYAAELVRRRLAELEEDDEKVAQMAAGLLFAGHETTVAAIDRGVLLLSLDPGRWDTLRADSSQVPGLVEEGLRMPSPLSDRAQEVGMPRYALADIDIDGHRIAKGDLVMLDLDRATSTSGASRAPRRADRDLRGFVAKVHQLRTRRRSRGTAAAHRSADRRGVGAASLLDGRLIDTVTVNTR